MSKSAKVVLGCRAAHEEIPVYQPGLDDLVARNLSAGRSSYAGDFIEFVGRADVVFLVLGTPSQRCDGYANLRYVFETARQIAPLLQDFTVVVTISTVPVGTGDEIERILRASAPSSCMRVRASADPAFPRICRRCRRRRVITGWRCAS